MTRWVLAVVVVIAAAGGCNKPDEGDCRKAIHNMQRLLGTDKLLSAQNIEGAVRSCRGASKKTSVECAIQAQTREALFKCPFAKEMNLEPIEEDGSGTAGSGSGTPPAKEPPPPAPAPPPPAPAPAPAPATGSGSGTGSGS